MDHGFEILVADEAQWNSFFSASVNKVPFSSAWWRNAICELFDYSADYIIVRSKGENLCGAVVYYTKGKTRFAKHPFLTPYNTIVFSDKFKNDVHAMNGMREFLDYIRRKYFYPYFVLDVEATALLPGMSGWNISSGNTFIVNPVSTVLDNDIIRRSRRCEEEGFFVNFSFNPEAFTSLYLQTVMRQQIAVTPDKDKFVKFINTLQASGSAWMASCFDPSGRIHASWMQVESDDKLYNWNAASDSSLMNKGGTSFLVTQMLMEIKKKYRIWDLCGADIPSVAKFKRGLGGELVPYSKFFFKNYSILEKAGLRFKRHFQF